MTDLVQFVEFIVRALVDRPDAVKVTATESRDTIVVDVVVGPQDTGQVIGRRGHIANALRTLASNVGSKKGRNVHVAIADPLRPAPSNGRLRILRDSEQISLPKANTFGRPRR